MSLQRSDVRLKLHPSVRAAVDALARAEGVKPTEYCETIIISVIQREVAKVEMRHRALMDQGVLGTSRADEVQRVVVRALPVTLRR